jgi:hypothetical protein
VIWKINAQKLFFFGGWILLLLLPGAELPLIESFGLLNDLFPFSSNLDAGYPVFVLYLSHTLLDVILPSVLVSSL